MTESSNRTPIDKLNRLIESLPNPERDLCKQILEEPLFATAPASSSHHPLPHQEEGGLALHTLEVAEHALSMSGNIRSLQIRALVASVFHDYGKIYEYEFVDGKATKTLFNKRIGHIPYSYAFFLQKSEGVLSPEDIDEISHAILAHHGRREWGSPVEPATKLAFILHTSDMLSTKGIEL